METQIRKPVMVPSRNLYEGGTFFGLTYTDFMVGTFILTASHKILMRWHHEIYSFLIGGLFFFGMVHLRLNTRPGMIQDFLSFHLTLFKHRFGLTHGLSGERWLNALSRVKESLARWG